MATNGKNKGGRPSPYKPEFDDMAYVACVEGGFTIPKLAKLFGVSHQSIKRWMAKYDAFRSAINRGRDEFDSMVAEQSLIKVIKGFTQVETHKEKIPPQLDEDGNPIPGTGGMVTTKKVRKTMSPDGRAIQYFLNNRQRGRWRNLKAVELSGPDGGPMNHNHTIDDVAAALLSDIAGSTKPDELTNLTQEMIDE